MRRGSGTVPPRASFSQNCAAASLVPVLSTLPGEVHFRR